MLEILVKVIRKKLILRKLLFFSLKNITLAIIGVKKRIKKLRLKIAIARIEKKLVFMLTRLKKRMSMRTQLQLSNFQIFEKAKIFQITQNIC